MQLDTDVQKVLNESDEKTGKEYTFADWCGEDLSGQSYNSDIDCSEQGLTSLKGAPQIVYGNFNCSYNKLTSLEGAPEEVWDDFNCSFNQLTSLEGAPERVDRHFECNNNQLTSLKGAPQTVDGHFDCSHNKLTSLEGAPQSVKYWFDCSHNKLASLKGVPQIIDSNFDCSYNKLTSLQGGPQEVSGDYYCNYNQLTSLKGAPEDVYDFECKFNKLTSLEGAPQSTFTNFICSDNKLTSLEGAPEIVGGHFLCDNNQLTSLKGAPKEVGWDFDCRGNLDLKSLDGLGTVKGEVYTDIVKGSNEMKIDEDVQKILNKDISEDELLKELKYLYYGIGWAEWQYFIEGLATDTFFDPAHIDDEKLIDMINRSGIAKVKRVKDIKNHKDMQDFDPSDFDQFDRIIVTKKPMSNEFFGESNMIINSKKRNEIDEAHEGISKEKFKELVDYFDQPLDDSLISPFHKVKDTDDVVILYVNADDDDGACTYTFTNFGDRVEIKLDDDSGFGGHLDLDIEKINKYLNKEEDYEDIYSDISECRFMLDTSINEIVAYY